MPGTTLPAQRTVKNKDKVSALKLLECWQQEADREQGNTGKEEQTGGSHGWGAGPQDRVAGLLLLSVLVLLNAATCRQKWLALEEVAGSFLLTESNWFFLQISSLFFKFYPLLLVNSFKMLKFGLKLQNKRTVPTVGTMAAHRQEYSVLAIQYPLTPNATHPAHCPRCQ